MVRFRANIPRPSVLAGEPVPPLHPVIGECGWFYNEDAGGFIMPFGKYCNREINGIPFGYITWFQGEFKGRQRCEPLLNAANKYKEGLEDYMEDHYGEFLVPVGKVYRGTRIDRVRNKPWMRWLQGWISRHGLAREHENFLDAVQLWLDNPHHQEVKRDIGERTDRDADDGEYPELLPESEWEDDLGGEDLEDDLYTQEKDTWEKEDLDFLDNTDACPMIMNGSDDYVPSEGASGDESTSEDSFSDQSMSDEEGSGQEEGGNVGMDEEGEGEEDSDSDGEGAGSQDEPIQESSSEEGQMPLPAGNRSRKSRSVNDEGAGNTKHANDAPTESVDSDISDMDDDEPLDVMQERILSTPKKDRRRYPKRRCIQSPSPDMSDEMDVDEPAAPGGRRV